MSPQIEALQGSLGDINDHVVACRKITSWLPDRESAAASRLRAELDHERLALRGAVRRFELEWDLATCDSIHSQMRQLIESHWPPTETVVTSGE